MSNQGASNQSAKLGVLDPSSPESIIETLALVLICLSSIIGNSCVITAVARSEKLRERPGSYLVGSLAILDGFLMPVAMAFHITLRNFSWTASEFVCNFLSDYLIILIYIVILHLFLMSWDRFISVVYPLHSQIILSRRKIVCLLIPAWIVPVFSMGVVPLLINTHEQGISFRNKLLGCIDSSSSPSKVELTSSKPHQLHLLFNTLLFVVGPFLVMLVLYGKLSLISSKQENKVGANVVSSEITQNERRVKAKKTKEMKWAKTVGIVIGAFALTYLPVFACTLVEAKLGHGVIPQKLFSFFAAVIFLNSAINAVVYSFRSQVYRKEFKRIVRDLVRKFVPGFGAQEGHCFHVGEPQPLGLSLHAQEAAQTQASSSGAIQKA
ncbi:trace amine-associated receptor 1-like [Actinia tenebrosa]|uniref:Trace amine-associated receptor 1-like n=1 Tax=Actinia tenebrosa TaxID=6105 RepID=A0A6P8HZN7_ACTTE|nr:trace amine-associated receptor 1-like [Actinia tenebrosa]